MDDYSEEISMWMVGYGLKEVSSSSLVMAAAPENKSSSCLRFSSSMDLIKKINNLFGTRFDADFLRVTSDTPDKITLWQLIQESDIKGQIYAKAIEFPNAAKIEIGNQDTAYVFPVDPSYRPIFF